MSFENFGKRETVSANDRMECGICWYVYDPAQGDPAGQIPRGTPFSELPEEWRCPACDGAQTKFMRLGDER